MRFVSVLGMLFVGCGGGGDSKPDADVVVGDACVATSPRIAYLHRGGGTYTSSLAVTDSRTNTTGIVSSTVTLPAPTIVEQDWLDYVACVESKFAPFNISITTTDPGTAPHFEVVVIDDGSQINQPSATAITTAPTCSAGKGVVVENGISFVAWGPLADTGNRCQKSSQTIGFLLGLDRAYACNDIMTWDTQFCVPRGDTTFVDADVPCGETEPRMCHCGFPTENTFRALQQAALQCPP
jgi:hypothetical protein